MFPNDTKMTNEATPIPSLAQSRLQIPNPVHNCKLTSDAKCNIKCTGYSRGTSTDDMHNGSTHATRLLRCSQSLPASVLPI
ncbi:hypothetical protein RHGRI_000446 [Rhododendron griersonianum]|uniref:Uncharacterized protein n=1 Tax=Rhododendron griersonianum TaxID=479676 RepID=A0AAV6LHN8_9ERIC|nr:hypothetical protein RHGRI_000446 [Rhododendron griersonianum]